MPHRDPLDAARARIQALEDKVTELEAARGKEEHVEQRSGTALSAAEKKALKKGAVKDATPGAGATDAAVRMALETHPTTKDALVGVLGGILVMGLVGAANLVVFAHIDEARRLARLPALFDQPLYVGPVFLAILLLGLAVPRIYHPVPIGRVRSEDGQFYSPGVRLSRPAWAAVAAGALVLDVLVFVLAR